MENAADQWQKNTELCSVKHATNGYTLSARAFSPAEYTILCCDDDPWICNDCSNIQFSDSFFENDVSTASEINDSIDCDIFEQLPSARRKHPKRFICAYLNINSLKHKGVRALRGYFGPPMRSKK